MNDFYNDLLLGCILIAIVWVGMRIDTKLFFIHDRLGIIMDMLCHRLDDKDKEGSDSISVSHDDDGETSITRLQKEGGEE